ncbi:MAG: hypothetical protein II234_01425, partial [Clostridia bacterium]|nr:hypothetical protein [Clostridia bacterium]
MKKFLSVLKKPICFIMALVLLVTTVFCLSLIPTLADENNTYSIDLSTVSVPTITANFADFSGGFNCPVVNGVTAPGKVKISADFMESEIEGKFTAQKDGADYALPADMVFTEDGKYTVTARNVKGSSSITFTIDSSTAISGKEKYYDFSGGTASATEAFTALKSFGDTSLNESSNVIVCNTQENATNKPWWGLRAGGTKLTTGNDAKGYKHNGYFCFKNVDEDGNKYSAINLTYTIARQSGFPSDAKLKVYSLNESTGSWIEIPASGVKVIDFTGNPAAEQRNATYFLGQSGGTVKIEFDTPTTYALWKAGFLSVLDLKKLVIPTIAAFEEGARISSGDMAMDEVTLEFTDTAYWFVEKDGVLIDNPKNKIVSEDGKYKVTACGYMGKSVFEFQIDKDGGINPDDLIQKVTKKYDIYNTGELGAISYTNKSNKTQLEVKDSAKTAYPKLTPD